MVSNAPTDVASGAARASTAAAGAALTSTAGAVTVVTSAAVNASYLPRFDAKQGASAVLVQGKHENSKTKGNKPKKRRKKGNHNI